MTEQTHISVELVGVLKNPHAVRTVSQNVNFTAELHTVKVALLLLFAETNSRIITSATPYLSRVVRALTQWQRLNKFHRRVLLSACSQGRSPIQSDLDCLCRSHRYTQE